MYVGLFVRDGCERSMKNQTSKVTLVDFVTGLQVLTCKRLHKKHMLESKKSYDRLDFMSHFATQAKS